MSHTPPVDSKGTKEKDWQPKWLFNWPRQNRIKVGARMLTKPRPTPLHDPDLTNKQRFEARRNARKANK